MNETLLTIALLLGLAGVFVIVIGNLVIGSVMILVAFAIIGLAIIWGK